MSERVETVIVGGGQAGLALSYYLQTLGHEHVVLERGRVVERWRSERWDSLHFQFPNWTLRLPGFAYRGPDPEAFSPCADVVRFLDEYADFVKPPLRSGVAVERVTRKPGSSRLLVQTADATFEAASVVLATGPYQRARRPAWSGKLPPGIVQLHSTEYRNPDQFPAGAVLVVGSGASGSQIVEELITHGRRVFLSVGRHRRYPRRHRGRDLYWWLEAMGVVDQTDCYVGKVAKYVGGRRTFVACSNEYASLIRLDSSNGRPMNVMPTGRPNEKPAGTVTSG